MKTTLHEPARDIPVLGEYDVIVCGGGPAGCAAAIAAARHGAKTLLVEKDGYLGGATVSQIDNLLVAGRCLSVEHTAQSSLRIQQTCMATGQAAGTAAALSLRAGVTPAALDPAGLVAQLARDREVEPAFAPMRARPG